MDWLIVKAKLVATINRLRTTSSGDIEPPLTAVFPANSFVFIAPLLALDLLFSKAEA